MEHSPVWPVYYIMRNIRNKHLTKLIKDKRFTTTVYNWGTQSTTFNYRITNIKMASHNGDPVQGHDWQNTIVNIVCSGYTTNHIKKKTSKRFNMETIDKRYSPIVRDCVTDVWSWNMKFDPKAPRSNVRYGLLCEEYESTLNNKYRSNDLRNFLKHVGIVGDLKIGTIKLEPTPGM